jgi:hypothetical protein
MPKCFCKKRRILRRAVKWRHSHPGSTLTSIVYHIDVLMSKSNLI